MHHRKYLLRDRSDKASTHKPPSFSTCRRFLPKHNPYNGSNCRKHYAVPSYRIGGCLRPYPAYKSEEKAKELRAKESDILKTYADQTPLVRQLVDLALLSNNMLKGEALSKFIKRSVEML